MLNDFSTHNRRGIVEAVGIGDLHDPLYAQGRRGYGGVSGRAGAMPQDQVESGIDHL
jgi:hypothetical protein